MQAVMGITDGIIQGKISCFRNKFHKHKEKCSEKRKFLGALCLRSEIADDKYPLSVFLGKKCMQFVQACIKVGNPQIIQLLF